MSDIIKAEEMEMSESYQEAVSLHHQIMANGEMAANSFIEMCRCFKKMRDTALYRELGFSTFEEYSEQAVGVKQRQAYKYIFVYEKYGETQLKAHAELGITKLELIASVPAEERADFLEENDLSNMSVKDIKALVDELNQKGEQLKFLQDEIEELRSTEADQDIQGNEQMEQLNNEIASLNAKIAELENKPVDVGVVEPDEKTLAAIKKEAEKVAKEKAKADIEKAKADAAAKEQVAKREAEKKIKKIQEEKDRAEAQLKQLAAESAEANERAKKLEKELRLKSSAATTEVTVYFSQMQDAMNKIIGKITEIKKDDPETGAKLGGAMVRFMEQTLPVCQKLHEENQQ